MLSKSSWLNLRIPFSVFLMPVFLFALAISVQPTLLNIVLVFVVLHIFIYPASNGYNSYFDKDEKSIGGLKAPPKVTKELYFLSLLFDLVGIVIGLLISLEFSVMVLIYGLVSKAYSHPSIRIKKSPWGSWVIAGFFQGFFTFWMSYIGLNGVGFQCILDPVVWIPAGLSTLILLGSYPMTQIYQHEEDQKRGDVTLSYLLGIKGTFLFTGGVFLLAVVAYFLYFNRYYNMQYFVLFIVFLAPVLFYFNYWFVKVLKDDSKADFTHTMRLNLISSLALSVFFIVMYLQSH